MPVKGLTQAEIEEATRAQVASGAKSTDRTNRLPGETASEANARITAAYKEMTAKPILSQEQIDGGMKVQFVRTAAGGAGEYVPIKPIGYTGPTKVENFTPGVIPANSKYTTGTSVGFNPDDYKTAEDMQRITAKLASGGTLTADEQAFMNKGVKTSATTPVVPTPATTTSTKTKTKEVKNADGSTTITYSDGTKENILPTTSVNTTTPKAPVGTPPAYVYDSNSKTWNIPPKPTTPGNWTWDNNEGWTNTTVVPGSSGMATGSEKTLAIDTFRNTISLLFGPKEASQPWVTALYTSASKFYNTGSTVDESINLSLQDVRNNKELKPFTDRFKGIYALTDRLAGGEAIEVPTVAEYFKSEAAMGDVLRAAGMGDIATQDFLGEVIGRGKSVLEVTNLITDTFDRIDNAPSALKADLQAYFPGADRTSIAKAMLTGEKGVAELNKKIKAITVQSAAKTQGLTVNDLTSEDIAGQGYDYNESLNRFATVKQLQRGNELGKMSGIDLTQQEAISATFQSNAAAAEKIRKIKEDELNRFGGSSGKLASRSRAQGII